MTSITDKTFTIQNSIYIYKKAQILSEPENMVHLTEEKKSKRR